MSTLADQPPVAASLQHRRLSSIRLIDGHRLCLRFRDDLIGELDFLPWLLKNRAPMNDPLLDEHFFSQVYLDHGALTWPNGFDLDPTTVRSWAERGYCD
jgi:hypothetical protein